MSRVVGHKLAAPRQTALRKNESAPEELAAGWIACKQQARH